MNEMRDDIDRVKDCLTDSFQSIFEMKTRNGENLNVVTFKECLDQLVNDDIVEANPRWLPMEMAADYGIKFEYRLKKKTPVFDCDVDYSNKKDLDTIMDLKIEKKNAPSHEEILPSGTVLNIPSGGTFEACPDGKLLKVSRESGYAVGTHGIQIKSSELTDSILADLAKKYNSEFVGYWISDGVCYVDCVEIVDDLEEAIFLAVKFNQLEIYDFSNHTCYEIGPNQIDEKSYFCNVVRRYNIANRDIVVVSELVDQYGSEEFVTGCELSDSESLREFNVKYNPMRKIDSGIVQFVNQSQSQSRRENNVNGRDVS